MIVRHVADFARDVRASARSLAAAPGFVLTSAISIGLGIGLATTVFCEYRSTLFRPLPGVSGGTSLVTILQPVSYQALREFRDASGQFSELAAFQGPVAFVLRTRTGQERVWGQIVTPDYFRVLRVRCTIGRTLGPEDSDGNTSIVISDRLWQARFGRDPAVLARTLPLGGRSVTVVGVAAPGFLGASPLMSAADVWVATSADAAIVPELARQRLDDPGLRTFVAIGRLRAGVTVEQTEIALDGIVRRLDERNGERLQPSGRRIALAPGGNVFPIRDQDLPLVFSFPVALVGLTLWVGCANVATMSLARAMGRRRDTAIRLALGASRSRIVRQLLTESVMLALVAAALGCCFSYWSLGVADRLRPMMPGYMDLQFQMDRTALIVASAIGILAGVLFGLAPALRSARVDISTGIRTGVHVRLAGYRSFSVRNLLVLQQVAGSLTLLLLTGFIVLGFGRSASVDPGFDPHGLFSASLDPRRDGYTPEATADILDRLEHRLTSIPGIRMVAFAEGGAGGAMAQMARAKSRMIRDPQMLRAVQVERIGPRYFETMRIPLVLGRPFTVSESRPAAAIAIVNETMARGLGSGGPIVGRTLEVEGKTHSIIGVARDVRGVSILRVSRSMAYLPLDVTEAGAIGGVTLIVRAEPGVDVPREVRGAARSLDPALGVFDAQSMTAEIQQMLALVRAATFVYGGIGLFGLALAAIGLGGVTAYAVAQRRKEIAIRMALGARAANVLRLVLREGAWLVGAGTVVGLLAALAIGRTLGAYIELVSEALRTSVSDPVLLVGGPLILAIFTMLACLVPASRSTRVDPVVALKEE